ncbi:hypothetical protein ONS95_014966 [Cadophora gregata]|uniref:uncharacterized protein n=1 Tax=Cadophora gregata TaxID=51156 RepID=UPI0026DBE44D|nr:uncharacterized protein ONS95_014966 [Cadophora gregata]KAK0103168.1 hypothetical protein ONS96_005775 [Cadophora gregata f. sp. sojae]KAK0113271.1 hypothetical protein ONS95_014966 [Cadophora gregata]
MKLLRILLLILLSAIAHVQSQSSIELSACSLSCVAQSLPAAGCSLIDADCQCKSKLLSHLTAGCMLANCTMQESLDLSRVQAVTCSLPFEDKSQLMIILFSTIIVFTSILVILRLASKFFIKTGLGMEDYIAALAQCLSIASEIFSAQMAKLGFGKHIYSLKDGALQMIFLKFYIAENIYVIVLGLVKISILTFYLRIFQHEARFRLAVYSTIVFIALGTTTISALTIFQCHPVPYFWDKDVRNGTCVDINALAYANSGLSIVQDLMIVVLPIRLVWRMGFLEGRKRVGVAFMFALGGLYVSVFSFSLSFFSLLISHSTHLLFAPPSLLGSLDISILT